MDAGAGMAEQGAKDDLEPDGAGNREREPPQPGVTSIVGQSARSEPALRGEHRQRDDEPEKELRDGGVDDRQVQREPHDPEPAQQTLEGHEGQGADASHRSQRRDSANQVQIASTVVSSPVSIPSNRWPCSARSGVTRHHPGQGLNGSYES